MAPPAPPARRPPARTAGQADDTVTAQLQALETELATQKATVDGIFAAAVDALILINDEGVIEMFNHAAEAIFDYPREQIIGQNVTVLMPEPYASEHNGYIQRYVETGERRIIGIGRELVGKRRDGSEFPMDLSVGTVTVKTKRIYRIIVSSVIYPVEKPLKRRSKNNASNSRTSGAYPCSAKWHLPSHTKSISRWRRSRLTPVSHDAPANKRAGTLSSPTFC